MLDDLRLALRQVHRSPGFAAAVIATLALAIGVNTAVFSIVNALMLRSLPYPQPERMGTIFRQVQGSSPYDGPHGIDGEQWELLRDNVPALVSAVSGGASGVNLQSGALAQYVQDGRISAHYLDVLGIHLALGRNFSMIEDRPGGPPAVILSYAMWRNLFGASRDGIGASIRLRGATYTVIGVLSQGAETPLNADLYTALQPSRNGEGSGSNYDVITRLRPGATWQEADAEINRAWATVATGLASQNQASRVSFHSVPLQRGETASLRPQALALMAAAGFILIIACANLAGLSLVRMIRRTPEIATRQALGASHWRIEKQLWTETLLLACAGGALAVGVGYLALHGMISLLPQDFLPVASVPLDGRVLTFTLLVSVLTSVLFGILPAFAARKLDLRSAMATRAVAGSERIRLRQALIAGEVAFTVVLLAGAGLLIRTLIHLETLPPGFSPRGVMTAKASLDDVRYHDPAAFRALLDESIAAMRRIPGVEDAAVGLTLPDERVMNEPITLRDGINHGQQVQTDVDYVTPGFFRTLKIPLLAGRVFSSSDGPKAQPVAIVNHTFADKFYKGASPVGHTLDNGTLIVGMVADTQITSGLDPVAPLQNEETMYIPAAQITQPASLAMIHTWLQPSWIVRTRGPIEGLTGQMQRALASAAPGLPFSGFYAMSSLEAKTLATQRIEVALLGTLAGLALLLSALGIYALVSNLVVQRTREIGIRIALGSTLGHAMRQIASSGLWAACAGAGVGLVGCFFALRLMKSAIYGVGTYDPVTLVTVPLLLVTIAAVASVLPALRIARIDPAETLRAE